MNRPRLAFFLRVLAGMLSAAMAAPAPVDRGPELAVELKAADIAGKRTGARVPWRSRDSGDMATGDVYTEALLRPQTWGIAVLE
jgi:hypothetical protein